MKSATSKLLHTVAGRSLVSHAIRSGESVRPQRLVAVVGMLREQVEPHLAEVAPEVTTVPQTDDAYGTGHAMRCAMAALGDIDGEVVVLGGDVPMLQGETLTAMVTSHRAQQSAITILTARVPDPTGYGRIIRGANGDVDRIVEQKSGTPEELAVDEINSSIYVFDARVLRDGLARITDDNPAGEYLLTDVIGLAHGDGRRVSAWLTDDTWQTEGVNDRVQLAGMHAEMNRRILHRHMLAGVTILDPSTTWIHDEVELAEDVTIQPGTFLEGATTVASGAVIGPETTLIDCEVGRDAHVTRTHAELAVIGDRVEVGPYARLRPGTELGTASKIGTFVETKNTKLGAGAKAPHLSYLGDGIVGEGANIGAGVIFANYDGVSKSTTTVGRDSFVGSDSTIVAPRTIGDGCYVGAGSTITRDVEPGELAVARGSQRNIPGWVARKRSGTRTAEAAAAAAESKEHE
ncbi:MAG TPA: bifunctional UDP-N-acetylglucosamine diphosphorylase/glucosamine-1-phosphate N-acetyltransferase GlmU [Candidatus Avipropionibacterium avicola]|uniref:Bifunctional protein GlmU n=1 Tax=Candidatus Avipropionibacterium avicola TaxID=2840701 RepID=A0A9D1KM53_9ACTN|nr:bifunctional UDP-N-acetylglucosamine diphosphorylase/glucosamine-1-phosphate N-acetyltransferase GlmU [Candidatus Avipropionibacterium avicola]